MASDLARHRSLRHDAVNRNRTCRVEMSGCHRGQRLTQPEIDPADERAFPMATDSQTEQLEPAHEVQRRSGDSSRRRRWFVLVGTLIAFTLAWLRLAEPTHRAHEFAAVLRTGKLDEARSMLTPGQTLLPSAWTEPPLSISADVYPQGVSEHWLECLWRGERRILVSLVGSGESRSYWFRATSSGIERTTPDDLPVPRQLAQAEKSEDQNSEKLPEDIADLPVQDLHIKQDPQQRYFLIGLQADRPAPKTGYRLLLVLPGGNGDADFSPFVRRIYKNALDESWLVAQLVAPTWDARQKRKLVWPTSANPYPGAAFTTEQFADRVIADVSLRAPINRQQQYLLAWSSGGPPSYAIALRPGSPIAGAYLAMSIGPGDKAPLGEAKDRRFFLLQSPQDRITPFHDAERAQTQLTEAGATVRLESYEGGHGWRGDVWGHLRRGLRWISSQPD